MRNRMQNYGITIMKNNIKLVGCGKGERDPQHGRTVGIPIVIMEPEFLL